MGWARTSAEILQRLENPPLHSIIWFYIKLGMAFLWLYNIDDEEGDGEDDDE